VLFIDLRTRLSRVRSEVDRRIAAVLDHGQFILGPEVEELEEKLADYVGVKHCVGVSSGTDALLIALMALEIGPGDEVITVPYTWISTAEVIVLLGAKPVFVDIRPDTWNMDPELLEDAITERTRAIIPVGIYGQPPDMDSINEIAQRHNLTVIEDAAQSFGAIYKGKRSCALSAIGCTSFFPTKPLGGFGDGGAMFTNDDALAEKFRQIRVHGQSRKHHHPLLGVNGRLDTLQAAALLAIFGEFENEIESRQAISNCYDKLLQFVKSVEKINIQKVRPDTSSVYAQYTILSPERDALQNQFWDAGIPTVAYYKIPLHMQPVFRELRYKQGDFSVAEEVSNQCLSLPVCTNMSKSDQQKITKVLAALN
tara:strand:+ start:4865 stop:5968 length:1104 start_codon:yes stop_codon:yes gene_type:complete